MRKMIVIIDCGMGNLGSILNVLKKIDTPARVSSDIQELTNAERYHFSGDSH